ncbi:tetraacyldisaccharide 4'-kinase [Acinetobacter ihumii]|uniref:tetraacyldisaccharide 4'-kinase n=1 Tax=Acinetobacter ihumii TaxID=2483802 RepID=UPI0010304BA4|nr:tetraacyldisaccharide 4'-kinase [Acinetobacter ihumii]
MSFAQLIQEAWSKQAKWLIVLRPLSWLYRAASDFNHQLYKHGIKSVYTAPVPVLVIGNITVGGSGKTPLLIQLVNYLQQHQIRVGVISRGYGGEGPFPALVNSDALPNLVGDEPCLIVQSTQVPMAVGPDRKAAIELLLNEHQLDLIISDDGLQHWALDRQIEWIVLDLNRGLGNEKLLPEGYLREPKQRLASGTVIEHGVNSTSALHMHLRAGEPYLLNPKQDHALTFQANDAFYAVVGIGYPQRFYQTLESIGVTEFQCHEFPDHYDYDIQDLQFEDQNPIITTEKDAVKILALLKQYPDFSTEIWVVPVEAVLSEQCYQLLAQQLNQFGIHLS